MSIIIAIILIVGGLATIFYIRPKNSSTCYRNKIFTNKKIFQS